MRSPPSTCHPETLDYRLVRQRRDGPDVLAEMSDRDAMADRVADYVADRIVEHEGLAPAGIAVSSERDETGPDRSETETPDPGRIDPAPRSGMGFWPGFLAFRPGWGVRGDGAVHLCLARRRPRLAG